jgi:hypothetical protein
MSDDYKSYVGLALAIITQAIQDYACTSCPTICPIGLEGKKKTRNKSCLECKYKFYPYRDEITSWVKNKSGTFDLCAAAWNKDIDTLQQMMFKKMKDIDNGENIKQYFQKDE